MSAVESKKIKMQSIFAVITVVIGILLMIMKIYEDSEPGAIPLLLIFCGIGLYFIKRTRFRSQQK